MEHPARLLLAQCYAGLGKDEAATPLVAELRAAVSRGATMFEPPVLIAEAWLAAAEGHLTGAVATAVRAADLAAESGQRTIELLALHAAARFGDRSCLQRLIDVATAIGGPLADADAAHAAGLLNNDAAQVYSAAQDFERAGALLSAADACAQASAMFEAAGERRHALKPPPPHRSPCRPVRWPGNAGPARHLAPAAAERPGVGDRQPGRAWADQPRHRRTAGGIHPHRRGPPVPDVRQAQHHRP